MNARHLHISAVTAKLFDGSTVRIHDFEYRDLVAGIGDEDCRALDGLDSSGTGSERPSSDLASASSDLASAAGVGGNESTEVTGTATMKSISSKKYHALDASYHLQLRHRYLQAYKEMNDTGELMIPLANLLPESPDQGNSVDLKAIATSAVQDTVNIGDVLPSAASNNAELDNNAGEPDNGYEVLLDTLVIRVEFSLIRPSIGAFFMEQDAEYPTVRLF